jgi:hypothetical protein
MVSMSLLAYASGGLITAKESLWKEEQNPERFKCLRSCRGLSPTDEDGGSGEPSGTGRQESSTGGAWGTNLPSLPPASRTLGDLWERLKGFGSSVSSRFTVPMAALPSYVHFGRQHVPPLAGPAPPGLKLPVRPRRSCSSTPQVLLLEA